MLINRQFYTMKFKSSRLKEYEYNFNLTFEEAQINGEIIALADNQILRSIRDIKKKQIDLAQLEEWYVERDKLKKQKSSKENADRIIELKDNIYKMMFIPEYITIVMEHPSHYKYLFENSLLLNDKRFVRFSSSASQSRVSTVVFCDEEIVEKLDEILDNGRDKNKSLIPSKFNAYKGLAGSNTKVVSTPRFCVVPDLKTSMDIKVNFVTETDKSEDDIIEVKDITAEFNRFDGMGLISYEKALAWSEELGLDYVPSQWCVRQNFLKGMLCVFDIHRFCEEINDGNYNVNSVYKDPQGNNIIVNLKDIDVIVSEGQFKLWDSFDSIEVYQENCKNNNLQWGVSLYSPKEDKDILKMNYQFNQTLKLNKKDIEKICEKTVNWINGVTSEDIYYTLLFLIGENISEESFVKYMNSPKNYWVKSLIVNHELIKDKYIRNKIYNLVKKKIKRACLGDIFLDGNFQTLVSDPFAMMQHVCGLEVTGLLNAKEYYSNYWNNKGIKVVDSMRAPLTYRSEHLKLNLVQNEELDKWYKYCNSGIIVNVHGMETMHWAGSDWDMDAIATTSDTTIISGVYENELPVVYEAPKSDRKLLTQEDLYKADLFAFGSIIGSITNKSTSAYALLPLFKEDSEEYKITMNRLKMCTKLQSAQIDKAKIGKEVKGIPYKWVEREKYIESDSEELKKQKDLHNSLLLDRHPYFFIYLYKHTKSKYNKYVSGYDLSCKQKFGISLEQLITKKRKTLDEQLFLNTFEKYMPVIDSDCVANNICKYIESINFNIKNKLKLENAKDLHKQYQKLEIEHNENTFIEVLERYNIFRREIRDLSNVGINTVSINGKHSDSIESQTNGIYEKLKEDMTKICSNVYELVNYLVEIFYIKLPNSNKDLLWNLYGKHIFNNVKNNRTISPILFPFPNKEGTIEYLNKKYKLMEVEI